MNKIRFVKFTDDELIRLQDYIDYDDEMYKELQDEFKERKYIRERHEEWSTKQKWIWFRRRNEDESDL